MYRDSDHLRWIEQSRRKLGSYSIFDLYLSRRRAADGRSGDFYLLSAPDWVNVIPVLLDDGGRERFLMVRQYRHGANIVTTEFPAGLVNPGETHLAAAERELEEETGRKAGRMTFLGRICPNPAFMDNWCNTYLAEELSAPGGKRLDSLEILDVREVSKEELTQNVGSGEFVNSLVMAALLWYTLRRAKTE
jgi:ADP-ribose pyrophosphatase